MTSALPEVQVLVDWENNPIGPDAIAGNNFTDISQWVKLSEAIDMSRGRQDNISVVQPSRCTVTVHNDDGRFTPGSMASPYFPGVILGRRIQVNVQDEGGAWNTRFDGMISEYDINDTPTGRDTTVTIICTDVLAFLNRYPGFSCWTVQECQFQASPILTYLCNDNSAAGGLAESSGNGGPTLVPATYTSPPFFTIDPTDTTTVALTAPTITYQSGQNPVEAGVEPTSPPTPDSTAPVTSTVSGPLQSVNVAFTLVNDTGVTPAEASPSGQFSGKLKAPLKATSGKAFTLVGWIWPDGKIYALTDVTYNCEVLCLGNSRTSSMLSVEINANGGLLTYQASFFDNYVTNSAAGVTTDGPESNAHFIINAPMMVAIVVDGTSANFYLGGNLFNEGITLLASPHDMTVTDGVTFDTLLVGGPLGGGNGFAGNISNVNVYDVALNTTQLTDLANYGAVGPELKSVGTAFTRATVQYTGLPSYWVGTIDDGLSHTDYFDITGSGPGTVIQTLQQVEHGLAFIDSSGKLNFHDRSRRMGATASPVVFPAGSYNVGIAPKVNDSTLINYASYQNNRGGTGITSQDADSVASFGVYADGSVTSPTQAPYPSFGLAYQAHEAVIPTDVVFNFVYYNRNITDAASWNVNTLGKPGLKLAEMTVDRLGNLSGQDEYIAPSVLYGLEIDDVISVDQNLPWWPGTPLSSELFLEGINERYSTTEASVAFYTSPAYQYRGWLPGDSTYGQLDVTARVGISKTGTLAGNAILWPVPPTYSTSMNLGAGVNGFVGATDQAGISENLQRLQDPPMLLAAQKVTTQTEGIFGSGSFFIAFDTVLVDSVGGFNFVSEGGVSYNVQVPGWYEVFGTAVLASTSSTNTYTVMITHNQSTAVTLRQLAPTTAKGTTGDLGITTSAVAYFGLGDNISINITTNSTSLTTSVGNGGSSFSVRFLGQGTNRN